MIADIENQTTASGDAEKRGRAALFSGWRRFARRCRACGNRMCVLVDVPDQRAAAAIADRNYREHNEKPCPKCGAERPYMLDVPATAEAAGA